MSPSTRLPPLNHGECPLPLLEQKPLEYPKSHCPLQEMLLAPQQPMQHAPDYHAGFSCQKTTPITNIIEASASGAHVVLVKGLIDDCGKLVREGCERHGWFDLSTLKEPFRIEGKKTMGYELPFDLFDVRENTRLRLPDCIIYPTGGGTGLIGMWKAFDEMEQLGWIGPERPRMVVAQATGCAPIVRAWDQGETHAERIENATTVASGLRVPAAIGDFIMLRILKKSGGTALAVSDQELLDAQKELTRYQGVFAAPESGATWAVAKKLLDRNWLKANEEIILFNTSTGIKYSQDPPTDLPVVDPSKTDWKQILETTYISD